VSISCSALDGYKWDWGGKVTNKGKAKRMIQEMKYIFFKHTAWLVIFFADKWFCPPTLGWSYQRVSPRTRAWFMATSHVVRIFTLDLTAPHGPPKVV
jgi:hypothetical protein